MRTRLAAALPGQRTRTVGAFTALTVALATLALLHDGTLVDDLELHDGGVWVTNLHLRDGSAVAAHLNYQSRQFDSFSVIPSHESDISQEANQVVVHDPPDRPAISTIDTATWTPGTPSALPRGASASQGTDIVAVADPNKGTVWAFPATDASQFSPEATDPVLSDVIGVRITVGKDDVVHAVTPDGTLRDLHQKGSGWSVEKVGEVPAVEDPAALQLATVGADAVVLDPAGGWLAWRDHRVDLEDADAMLLQQSGYDVGSIALSGPASLVEVPLDGGDPRTTTTGATGEPVAPVTVGECTYAAWSVSGQYVRHCANLPDVERTYDKLRRTGVPDTHLVFRTNRDKVVLNDTGNGDVFLVDEDMALVNDWRAVLAQLEQDRKDDSNDPTIAFHRTRKNQDPEPKPDEFGVRAGSSVTLPVLANDTDGDGDLLSVDLSETTTRLGRLEVVRDGRAIRIEVPGDASAPSVRFDYVADDGRGGTASTSVTVALHDDQVNGAVELLTDQRRPQLTIHARQSGEYHVLQDFKDPDGDPFWVDGVKSPAGLSVVWDPSGYLKVTDAGTDGDRVRQVGVTVTDGLGGDRVVQVPVTVLPQGSANAPPVANGDFVTVPVGEDVVVRPLRNDTDPDSAELYPVLGDHDPGLRVRANADDTYTMSSDQAKTYYVVYSASDGYAQSESVIRVDVRKKEGLAPIPDDDLAVVPANGQVLVPVLANDTDPLGGVLVLQSASFDARDGITAEVVDHEFLRVRDNGMTAPKATLTYRVANGTLPAEGTVTVVRQDPDPDARPTAVDDEAVVRSGDVVTVDVLDNDLSPSGADLHVRPLRDDAVTMGADLGRAFVSEDKVRFVASGDAGDVRIQYDVTDPDGNISSATVHVAIQPRSGSRAAPVPKPLTGRVIEGGTTDIPVPLDGIDPDGDSVTLVAVEDAPTLGQVRLGTDTITYSAPIGSTGTDVFSYVVEDEYGDQGVGEVQVGIAAPPATDQPPIAIPDRVVVQPDRQLAVPVTVNDIDPEGDVLSLAGVDAADGTDVDVSTDDGRVVLTTPKDEGTLVFHYAVDDGITSTEGALVVKVRSDAATIAPIARDDRVPLADVVRNDEVTVDVLHNDEDPDGAVSAIRPETDADVTVDDAGELVIPVTAERQVIPYTLKDLDGGVGTAVVVVPGSESPAAQRPLLRNDVDLPITVKAGTTKNIRLADYVVVRDGRAPVVAHDENVQAGPGQDGSTLVDDALTTITFGASAGFYGPTSVTAAIADGPNGDASTESSVITFPIFVSAAGETPPRLHVPDIRVARNEPLELDLDDLATDPDPGDQDSLTFSVPDHDPDLDVRVDEQRRKLVINADQDPPATLTFSLVVSDGTDTPPGRADDLPVTVVSSVRPLLQLQPLEIDAESGEPVDFDLADAVLSNPYDDDPTLVSATVTPDGAAEVETEAHGMTITPASGFHGRVQVGYIARDGSEDSARDVQGLVTVAVTAKPDPPTAVFAEATESHTVELDWVPGPNNGAPITGYQVLGAGREITVDGGQTTTTIRDLENGHEYHFQVVAHNSAGDSDPSGLSRGVVPDAIPPAPTGVTADFDDGALHLSWTQPAIDGTPIKRYEVRVNGTIRDTGSKRPAYDLAPVENGVPQRIQVRGVNGIEGEDQLSPWSSITTEHASGAPAITSVDVDADGPSPHPSATVTWEAEENGEPVTRVEIKQNGKVIHPTCTIRTQQCRVDLPDQEHISYTLRLFNREDKYVDGWSAPVTGNPVAGARLAGPVTNLRFRGTGVANQVRAEFAPADLHNGTLVDYRYQVKNGGTGSVTPGGLISDAALHAGEDVSITVWAVTTANESGEYARGQLSSATGNAFQPCTVDVSSGTAGYRQYDFTYTVTSRGRACDYHRSGGGDPQGTVPRNGTTGTQHQRLTGGDNDTLHLSIDAVTQLVASDDASVPTTASDSADGTTWNPQITGTDEGAAPNNTGNCHTSCHYFGARLDHWEPGGYGWCSITHEGTSDGWRIGQTWWYRAGPADGNGNWSGRMPTRDGHVLAWSTQSFGNPPPYNGCQGTRPSGNVDQ
ncbi:Ig-like domain-containing protein [Nocardioides sp. MH1]|uniref:Ig-like domain-containing protein n=1 Tax=Nocardioides sp. MH1 TaxID=3242490 RepID=UPI0035207380